MRPGIRREMLPTMDVMGDATGLARGAPQEEFKGLFSGYFAPGLVLLLFA